MVTEYWLRRLEALQAADSDQSARQPGKCFRYPKSSTGGAEADPSQWEWSGDEESQRMEPYNVKVPLAENAAAGNED